MSPNRRPRYDHTHRLALALAATGALAGCRADPATATAPAPESAHLQVINAARTPVDILVDGVVRVSALSAATVSSPLAVAAGTRRLEVRSAGSAGGAAAAQVTAQPATTALVAAQVGANGALATRVLDDTAAVPAPGTSKLRVLNLAPNAAPTRIWVLFPNDAAKAADPMAYADVAAWSYGGSTPFHQDRPGTWDVVITPASFTGGWGSSPTPPTDSSGARSGSSRGAATGSGSSDPHTSAIARLLVPVTANVAQTVVMLDAPGGGVRLATAGTP